MIVYYLTTAQFAVNNIALQRVKIARFSDLNDPFELLAVNLADRKSRSVFREAKERVNEETGVICFSTNWKSLLMWGHYADRHRGMALGLDIPNHLLKSVRYEDRLTKATIDVRKKRPSTALINKLL